MKLTHLGLLSVMLLVAQVAHAKKAVTSTSYFYSVVNEAPTEFAYAIPDCSKLTDRSAMTKCAPFGSHQACETTNTVELSNVINKQKKKITLIYHVFKTEKACIDDRNAALSGEE